MGGHAIGIGRTCSALGVPISARALLLAATLVCLGSASPSASAQSIDGLADAVAYYHEYATSDLAHLQEAAHAFEAIAIAYPSNSGRPDAWLPAYWAGLGYSQLALFTGDARMLHFLRVAEAYYVMASEVRPASDARVEADFMALRGLIAGLLVDADPDGAEGHRARSREAWEQARALDADNPMMLMNGGLALLPNPRTRGVAYQLLDRSILLYEERLNSVQPNWGREFIDVRTGAYPRTSGAR